MWRRAQDRRSGASLRSRHECIPERHRGNHTAVRYQQTAHALWYDNARTATCVGKLFTPAFRRFDEYAIVLPETTRARAAQWAETINAALVAPIVVEEYHLAVSGSMGVADSLIAFSAKNSTRINRVV